MLLRSDGLNLSENCRKMCCIYLEKLSPERKDTSGVDLLGLMLLLKDHYGNGGSHQYSNEESFDLWSSTGQRAKATLTLYRHVG